MPRLTARTRALLAERPRTLTYAHIEAATGLRCRWLERFAADADYDPPAGRVETLYEFLTGSPLDV